MDVVQRGHAANSAHDRIIGVFQPPASGLRPPSSVLRPPSSVLRPPEYHSPRMPVSVANSRVIYDALKAVGVRLMSALPETWLVHLIRMADHDPAMTLVRLAKEEEGVGVSAGAHFAGARSAMLLQNHGFLQAINGIVGVSLLYKIPLLMLITDRGSFGEKDPWQTEGGK